MVSPECRPFAKAKPLYNDKEIVIQTWYRTWQFNHHNGKNVEDRIGFRIGAEAFPKPMAAVIEEGMVLEIKSQLSPARDDLAVVYKKDLDAQMAIIMDPNATEYAKTKAVNEISQLNVCKTAEAKAIELQEHDLQGFYNYGVFRIPLPARCEVDIPYKKVHGNAMLISLIKKEEKTYKASAAVDMDSPTK